MSQAFMREQDDQWLHDVSPTLPALILYLTRENNGIRASEKRSYFSSEHNRQLYVMSDGLTYGLNDEGKWEIYEW